MEINKDELIEMMNEYWSLENNKVCRDKTKEFCNKYNISTNNVFHFNDIDFEE